MTPGHAEITQKSDPTRNRIAYMTEINNNREILNRRTYKN